ncbi:TraR/DksA family transcriptional regulator [Neolewinella antarctica]|uniref:RNA polymerase-binding transcription factor DksA n=1 Tax=Neolewinella antarctica TaxID=442734 RepID=A0ABX0XD95_9BACT|nr:TraR/DksA family transcriptional regulator [Neolewinella antarctica]NJC27226.1 RNA polymerase-binding transcription factor DksA [Neolewinella antarctica]
MQTKPQTRYSDPELAEFRALIVGKLAEANKQLAFYVDQLTEQTDSDDGKKNELDDGTHTSVVEELQNQANRQRKLIQHLEYALIRVDNKAYGICRATGLLIAKERLRLVPHATLSIAAKKSH